MILWEVLRIRHKYHQQTGTWKLIKPNRKLELWLSDYEVQISDRLDYFPPSLSSLSSNSSSCNFISLKISFLIYSVPISLFISLEIFSYWDLSFDQIWIKNFVTSGNLFGPTSKSVRTSSVSNSGKPIWNKLRLINYYFVDRLHYHLSWIS